MGHTSVDRQLKTGRAAHPPLRSKESPAGRKAGSPIGWAFRTLPQGHAWLWGRTQHSRRPWAQKGSDTCGGYKWSHRWVPACPSLGSWRKLKPHMQVTTSANEPVADPHYLIRLKRRILLTPFHQFSSLGCWQVVSFGQIRL